MRLDTILNPDDAGSGARESTAASPSTSSPSSSSSPSPPMDIVNMYAHNVNDSTKEHDPHPGCPNSLCCLPDTNQRPQHTLPIILRCTILGSPKKRLTIRDIYAAMEGKYSYYKTAGITWKQSVRHHLSLNRLFERQDRPVTDPGFGSYWTVNLEAPPGTKRPRKRGRVDELEDEEDKSGKRGRSANGYEVPTGQDEQDEPDEYAHASRLARNTPPQLNKSQQARSPSIFSGNKQPSTTSLRPPDSAGLPRLRAVREEDYESDEDMSVIDAQPPWRTPPRSSPNNASHASDDFLDGPIYERMRSEIEALQQQMHAALSERQRLTDQLSEAQADATRARAEARAAEKLLREEENIRREEEKLRRETEGLVRDLQRQLHEHRMSGQGSGSPAAL